MPDPIITVTPTIMDGTVVRWYTSFDTADRGDKVLSASRDGVTAYGYLHEIPADWLAAADGAYQSLRLGTRIGDQYAQQMATHRRQGFGPGATLEPIEETPA